jgi:hypothetical protein
MSSQASIGFRVHTGWAVLVAVAAGRERIRILHRSRVELLPSGQGRFVYHESAELPLSDAEKRIESVRRLAENTATIAIGNAIGSLTVSRACIPMASASLPELAALLQSHARIHAAEGALYAGAIASACTHFSIPVINVREREVWTRASADTRVSEAELRDRIDALRKNLGPPWTMDHKVATAAALIEL